MKALSLIQPWATLIALEAKRIETRGWSTSYRGPLAIAASKGFPRDCKDLCWIPPFSIWLLRENPGDPTALPLGAVICTCDLVNCVRMKSDNLPPPDSQEYAFGDYNSTPAKSRFMWMLENVKVLPEPVPCKGTLGLWEWNP
jgi:hypothetical protein